MYSNIKFYKMDNELHEIHLPVLFRGLKEVNTPGENSNTCDFNVYIYIYIYIYEFICLFECTYMCMKVSKRWNGYVVKRRKRKEKYI